MITRVAFAIAFACSYLPSCHADDQLRRRIRGIGASTIDPFVRDVDYFETKPSTGSMSGKSSKSGKAGKAGNYDEDCSDEGKGGKGAKGGKNCKPTASSVPSAEPSQCNNEAFKLADFKGISNAYSLDRGIIKIDWEEAFMELGDVTFDVFVALGEYDYESVLESMSVYGLVGVFTSEPTFQHFEVTETNEISVETPYFGENHSLLVTAQVGGEYSTNTHSKVIASSRSNPHIRDGVNVVGVFFPTRQLDIKVDGVPDGTEHSLSFIGPVSMQARSLNVGDIITGFTSEFDPFERRILEIIENTPSSVVLRVVSARIEEIFDELDLDGSFEVSRSGPVPIDCSFEVSRSGPESRRRKLGLRGWFRKNIIKPIKDGVIKPIGDAIVDGYNAIADLLDGEYVDKFSLVSIDEKLDIKVGDNVTIKGHAKVDMSLYTKLRIGFSSDTYVSIGAEAGYSLRSILAARAGLKREYQKEITILRGTRYSKIVWAGLFRLNFTLNHILSPTLKHQFY